MQRLKVHMLVFQIKARESIKCTISEFQALSSETLYLSSAAQGKIVQHLLTPVDEASVMPEN